MWLANIGKVEHDEQIGVPRVALLSRQEVYLHFLLDMEVGVQFLLYQASPEHFPYPRTLIPRFRFMEVV